MRRLVPGQSLAFRAGVGLGALAVLIASLAAGPVKKRKEPPPPKVQETVGDLAFVVSRGEMRVEGVGLVVGLDNTGGDSGPSWERKQLTDEMAKAGITHPDQILKSPTVSMVLVELTIPIGVGPTDRLDVQVEVPPGSSTKSLAGGYLLMTRLREVLLANNVPKAGRDLALAQGPVMIGTPARPKDPRVGRVLGGGRVKKENPYTLAIKSNRKSIRTSKLLENVVNDRFHETEHSKQKGVATAKTDGFLELRVPKRYHQNQEHFFRVVQYLPMVDSPELQARRIATWSQELLDPQTAGAAAMKLEGLGAIAIEPLKQGLKSPNEQVRFFAAEALAYLDDPTGLEVLGETVIKNADFRTYALAAIASMDQPAANLKLRSLMDQASIPVRYGAFNALRTLDPNDPFLGRIRIMDELKIEDEEDSPDSLAMAIVASNNRRRLRPEDPFELYVVDSEGPPLVHVSRSRRSEIVLFGRDLKLLPPIVLDAGPILLNASDHDETIEVSKIVVGSEEASSKITTSLDLAEVLRRTANLGASYPELVSILEHAYVQRNLNGPLVVDAVPVASPAYIQAILGKDITSKKDQNLQRTSHDSPRRRGFFGLFSKQAPPAKSSSDPSKPATDPNSKPTSPDHAKQDNPSVPSQPSKQDEDLQKAGLAQPTLRSRILDFFRGGN